MKWRYGKRIFGLRGFQGVIFSIASFIISTNLRVE
jgi:hypothetical protein